jgi:hypothetical protein
LVRLFYGKNLKKKKEEKNEALFINPLYSAGHNSHSSKTHCPAATQANLISTKSSPSLAFLSFFSIAIINHTHSQLHHPENQFPSSSSYYQEKL